MELDITEFFESADPSDYSASRAERGQYVGEETWKAAVADSTEYALLASEEEREEWRQDVRGMGAWDEEEIRAWSDAELNALLIQYISGDIREMRSLCADDWEAYEALAEQGTCSGRIFRGYNGRIYFYIGGS